MGEKICFLGIYPSDTYARYLLAPYLIKSYFSKYSTQDCCIDIFDFSERQADEYIAQKVKDGNYTIIAYSCYVWNIEKVKNIIRTLDNPNIRHILGGPEITEKTIADLTSDNIGDCFVIGPGEKTFLNLFNFFQGDVSHLREVGRDQSYNVVYVSQGKNKKMFFSCDTDLELSTIPSVFLTKILPPEWYRGGQAFLETQRGCRYRCRYCVYHKNMKSVRYYPLDRIKDEISFLICHQNISSLRIFDAVFTSDLERAKEIVRHLINIKETTMRIPWIYWEFYYNFVDVEFLELSSQLKEQRYICNTDSIVPLDKPQHYSELLEGYNVINCVGVQSLHESSLQAVGRAAIDMEKLHSFFDSVRKYNLVVKLDLILGLPLETPSSFIDGLEILLPFFEKTDHILNIHRLQILPGSGIETDTLKFGIEYVQVSPHYVLSTSTFSKEDLDHIARVSAVMLRVINSPLRSSFFEAKKRSGVRYWQLAIDMYDHCLKNASTFCEKVNEQSLFDDLYWNHQIYNDLSSVMLKDFLRSGDLL